MHLTRQETRAVQDMTFAELEQLREDLGISRERLCGRAEISPSTYKRWLQFLKGAGGSCPRPVSLKAVREVLAEAQRLAAERAERERAEADQGTIAA